MKILLEHCHQSTLLILLLLTLHLTLLLPPLLLFLLLPPLFPSLLLYHLLYPFFNVNQLLVFVVHNDITFNLVMLFNTFLICLLVTFFSDFFYSTTMSFYMIS